MSQSDYRIVSLAKSLKVSNTIAKRNAEILAAVVDRGYEQGIYIQAVLVAERGHSLRLDNPEFWKVYE